MVLYKLPYRPFTKRNQTRLKQETCTRNESLSSIQTCEDKPLPHSLILQYSYTMHAIYNWGKSTIYAMEYRNLWKPSFVYSKLSHSDQQQKSLIPPPSYRILNLFNIFFVRTQARKALSVGCLSNFPAVPLSPKKWKVKFAGRLTVRLSLVLHTDWGHLWGDRNNNRMLMPIQTLCIQTQCLGRLNKSSPIEIYPSMATSAAICPFSTASVGIS